MPGFCFDAVVDNVTSSSTRIAIIGNEIDESLHKILTPTTQNDNSYQSTIVTSRNELNDMYDTLPRDVILIFTTNLTPNQIGRPRRQV